MAEPPCPSRATTSKSFDNMLDSMLGGGDVSADWLLNSLGPGGAEELGLLKDSETGPGNSTAMLLPQPMPEPDDDDWSNLELYTEKHSVHKLVGEGESKQYILSNLKKFTMQMVLLDRNTKTPSQKRLRLKATLLYENSQPVKTSPGELILLGETVAEVVGGRAIFSLQMGKRALSAQHEKQRFRVKIEPEDPQIAAAYPCLTQLSEPLKSITKLKTVFPIDDPLPPPAGWPLPHAAAPTPPPSLPNYASIGNGSSGGASTSLNSSARSATAGGSSHRGSSAKRPALSAGPRAPVPVAAQGAKPPSHAAEAFPASDLIGLDPTKTDLSDLLTDDILSSGLGGSLPSFGDDFLATEPNVGGAGAGAEDAGVHSILAQQKAQIQDLARQNNGSVKAIIAKQKAMIEGLMQHNQSILEELETYRQTASRNE